MDESLPIRQLRVNETRQWIVAADQGGLRLEAFLAPTFPSYSRREITELISTGQVFLNGHPTKKGMRVQVGDTVVAPAALPLRPNATLPIKVVYADDTVVVLDKPAGIPSLALRHDEMDTVANFLLACFPDTSAAGSHSLEAGLVHRLDTPTSGLLLAARTPFAYSSLREQFRARTVEKYYLALVEGELRVGGQSTLGLAPAGPHGKRMRAGTTGKTRDGLTTYTPLEIFLGHSLVKIHITTGVRHQIRVHLATLGHPIVGDLDYGVANRAARLYLHAEVLSFTHPATNQRIRFASPPPSDFLSLVENLRAHREGLIDNPLQRKV